MATVTRYVNTGSAGGDGTTNNTAGATAAYASIAAALAAEATNLVTAGDILVIKCSGTTADASNNMTFSGFTTGANNYIQIESDSALAASRHPGYYSTGHYRIEYSGGNANIFATGGTTRNHFRLVGIQATRGQTAATGRKCIFKAFNYAGGDWRFIDCILRGTNAGAGGECTGLELARTGTGTLQVQNCVLEGFDAATNSWGILFGNALTTAVNIVNNTFTCAQGLSLKGSSVCRIYNNIFQCATAGYYVSASDNETEDYNVSSIADELAGAHSADDVTVNFASASNFHLAGSNTAVIGKGYDIKTNQATWWNGSAVDIDGQARGTTWDIGADEYWAIGTAAQTTAPAAQAGEGTTGASGSTGTSAQTAAPANQAASGAIAFTGTSTQTAAPTVQAGTGAQVISGTVAQAAAPCTQAARQAPVWSYNSNGVILRNNEPWFPLGFYHVSYYSGEKPARILDVRTLAAQGFNVVACPVDAGDSSLLANAAEEEVHVLLEFNGEDVDVFPLARHPAVMGWIVYDDVDSGSGTTHPVATVEARHDVLKAEHSRILTYASGAYVSYLPNYAGSVDVMGMQSYPVSAEEIESTHWAMNQVVDNYRGAGYPFIGNLQAFKWDGDRYPTAAEIRNMTYQALVLGVTGLIYYTLYDSEGYLIDDGPDTWAELQLIADDIATLQPYLLNGVHEPVSSGLAYYAHTALWSFGNQILIIATNTSETDAQSFSISLTGRNILGDISNEITRVTGVLTLSGTTVSGSIPARGIQVYSIERALAGTAATTGQPATQTASGAVGAAAISGTGASLTAPAAQAGVGALQFLSQAAQVLAPAAQTGAGNLIFTGQGVQTSAPSIQTGSGGGILTGTATNTIPAAEQAATGALLLSGVAAGTGTAASQTAQGALVYNGTVSQTGTPAQMSGAGSQGFTGTASQNLSTCAQVATGAQTLSGSIVQSSLAATQAATAGISITGAGASVSAPAVQALAARQTITGVGASQAAPATQAGQAYVDASLLALAIEIQGDYQPSAAIQGAFNAALTVAGSFGQAAAITGSLSQRHNITGDFKQSISIRGEA